MRKEGWLLDLFYRNGQMIIWVKTTDGETFRLTDAWKPRIHIAGSLGNLLDLACEREIRDRCRLVEKFETPCHRERSKILEIETESEKESLDLARKIQRLGRYSKYRIYDVDIPPAQIYLYEKDLFPLAHVQCEQAGETIRWKLEDWIESVDYELPPLRVAKLSLETRKQNHVSSFEDEIDFLDVQFDGESIRIETGSEVEKLLSLRALFENVDPDVVVTREGDSFLFPYLARRAQIHGLKDRLILGREHVPLQVYQLQGRSYFSYGKVYYRQTAAPLLGRLHVDEENSFIYDDCSLEGLFEVSRTCIIPIQRASRSTIGTSMTSLQLYHAFKQDILIPWNKNEPEDSKHGNRIILADRGGFIFEPKVGIYDDVGELDFSSLYPTLMTTKNLSGETVGCACCPDSPFRVPELNINICTRRQGIVPNSLQVLLDKRAKYKKLKKLATDPDDKERYEQRQAALKWILVCS